MTQIPAEAIFRVSEFLDLANELLKPVRVTIQGEITSFRERGAAVYFTLSDKNDNAKLNCLIWKNRLLSSGVELAEGLEIQAFGIPNIYKPTGSFTFMADQVSPVGEGALKKAFEKLKAQLEKQGYFSIHRKRQLPEYPKKIGLLTSKDGDAIRDFRTHLGNYGFSVQHLDVRVEGLRAVDSIVRGLQWFNQHPDGIEVIVLTRGGGSLESLQAFNSLEVAQAIFASKIPVVSAVGHEKDVTISDLVADVRASTPTDAGKILSRSWSLAQEKLRQYYRQFAHYLGRELHQKRVWLQANQRTWSHLFGLRLQGQRREIHHYRQNLVRYLSQRVSVFRTTAQGFFRNLSVFAREYKQNVQAVNYYSFEYLRIFSQSLKQQRKLVEQLKTQLTLSDPQLKLQQGYSIVFSADGSVLRHIHQVKSQDVITVQVSDGVIHSQVQNTERKK